jgi:hypothetical protein
MSSLPISLYLDLEKDERADLEVISRASLAFVEAIKEIAYIIDPSVEIVVEIESGTEGSLSLNTIIRSIKTSVTPNKDTLRAIVVFIAGWFADKTAEFAYHKFLETTMTTESGDVLSRDEKNDIIVKVQEAIKNGVAKEQLQQVFSEIEKDSKITGAGVTEKKGARPDYIVPRSEFKSRSGSGEIIEETTQSRSSTVIKGVTLISPVLVESSRSWKFQSGNLEFAAKVTDKVFLRDLYAGKYHVEMRGGIRMIVELKTDEEKKNGVWVTKSKTILRVIKLQKDDAQASLGFPPGKE